MAGFQGMDTAQVEDFSGLLGDRCGTVEDRFSSLQGLVRSIVGSQWIGPDADAFGDRYGSEVAGRIDELLEQFSRRIEELTGHIEEQEEVSSAKDGGLLGDILETLGDLFNGAVDIIGDFFENLIPTITNMAGVAITVLGDIAGGAIKAFAKSAPRLLGSAVPYVGDVFTGVMAGIERWNQDSHLPFGERLGRSLLDGGANFTGSLLGGLAGSAIGGSIGGALGGGGGAVAGSPSGPGAIFTAIGGGSLGAGIGMVVGDAIGSYVGGAAADAIIDSILD